jgi:hypothetical protein
VRGLVSSPLDGDIVTGRVTFAEEMIGRFRLCSRLSVYIKCGLATYLDILRLTPRLGADSRSAIRNALTHPEPESSTCARLRSFRKVDRGRFAAGVSESRRRASVHGESRGSGASRICSQSVASLDLWVASVRICVRPLATTTQGRESQRIARAAERASTNPRGYRTLFSGAAMAPS